jgi:hypothetical protein
MSLLIMSGSDQNEPEYCGFSTSTSDERRRVIVEKVGPGPRKWLELVEIYREDTNMTAQSSAQSLGAEHPINWTSTRLSVGIVYLACQIAVLAIVSQAPQVSAILETSAFVSLGMAATFLAYQSARSFSPGQTARRAWMFIAIMPLADAIAYAAFTMGDVLGTQLKSGLFVGAATALLSLTRILAAVAFLSMVRVYRKSGLRLELRVRDYFAMALITVMEVLALVFSSSGARASGGPQLEKLVLVTAIPMVIALAPCSVLGVIIWRYTTEMGGGLVAKAWRSNLLYGAAWLAYIAFNAIVARYLPEGHSAPFSLPYLLFHGTDWTLKGSEFLIFLGATYQYEACKSTLDYSDLSGFGA